MEVERKEKTTVSMLVVFIAALIIKGVIIPIIMYITNYNNESLQGSLVDALLQFSTLIVFSIIFFAVQTSQKKKEAFLYKQSTEYSIRDTADMRGFSALNGLYLILISVSAYIVSQLFKNVYLLINFMITNNGDLVTNIISCDIQSLFALFMIHVLWASIAEELFFRSMFFGNLLKRNRIVAYVATIVVFAFSHNSIDQMIQTLFFGFILCIIFEKTGSVLACILVHIVYNSLGMINTYLYIPRYGINRIDLNMLSQSDLLLEALKLLIVGTVVLGLVVLFIVKMKRTGSSAINRESSPSRAKLKAGEIVCMIIVMIIVAQGALGIILQNG